MHSQTQHTIPQSQLHTTPNIHYTSCRRPMQQQVITIVIFILSSFYQLEVNTSAMFQDTNTTTPFLSSPLSLSLSLTHKFENSPVSIIILVSLPLSCIFYWLLIKRCRFSMFLYPSFLFCSSPVTLPYYKLHLFPLHYYYNFNQSINDDDDDDDERSHKSKK